MGKKWDKNERDWDNERKRKGSYIPQYTNEEEKKMIRLNDTDLYDQGLLEIKRLVNEKNSAPVTRHAIYNKAINKIIDGLAEIAADMNYPPDLYHQELTSALQGGKYRKIYYDPTNDDENDIIDIERKKKSSKPKPKRKQVRKVIKKCKCRR